MSAYRNDDPPDYPEHPECCGELMDIDGRCLVCATCGNRQEIDNSEDYPEEADDGTLEELPDDFYMGPTVCPHGRAWHECDDCDHLSDLAYDAWREKH